MPRPLERRRSQRGSAYTWIAAVAAVVALAATGAGIYARMGAKVTIGTKDEIRYSGSATKEQALALGAALKADGYLTDQHVTVVLKKADGGTTIGFVVQDGVWNEFFAVAGLEEVGRDAAPAVGGYPVKVQLLNSDMDVKREMDIHPDIKTGDVEVRYSGSATETQAKALASALGKMLPSIVVLYSVNGGVKEMALVVKAGSWDDAETVSGLETVVRSVADTVGGLPVHMRLIDGELKSKKETDVR